MAPKAAREAGAGASGPPKRVAEAREAWANFRKPSPQKKAKGAAQMNKLANKAPSSTLFIALGKALLLQGTEDACKVRGCWDGQARGRQAGRLGLELRGVDGRRGGHRAGRRAGGLGTPLGIPSHVFTDVPKPHLHHTWQC